MWVLPNTLRHHTWLGDETYPIEYILYQSSAVGGVTYVPKSLLTEYAFFTGTDAAMAPPVGYAQHVLLPLLQRHLGVTVSLRVLRRGYFPQVKGICYVYVCHVHRVYPECPAFIRYHHKVLVELCISSVGSMWFPSSCQIWPDCLPDQSRPWIFSALSPHSIDHSHYVNVTDKLEQYRI